MNYPLPLLAEHSDRIWSMILGGAFALGLWMALIALLMTGCSDGNS